MSEKAWKKVERRVAAYFGTVRNPLSGGNARHSRSDSLSTTLFIEVKHGAGVPRTWAKIEELFLETERLARLENKIPLVVLHRKGSARVEQYDAFLRLSAVGVAGPLLVCVPLSEARSILSELRHD